MVALCTEVVYCLEGTAVEIGEIFAFGNTPSYFGHSQQARIHHVFVVFVRRDIFSPLIGLYAVYQGSFFGTHFRLYGVVGINFFQGHVTSDGFGLRNGRILVIV